jgi:Protein of unknown function (DUF3226)
MARRFPPRTHLTKPKLILCEGPSDEAFFRALLKEKSLPECCIRNTGEIDDTGRGGIDKFEPILIGMRSWVGFPDLTDILIIADNDLTPDANFGKVKEQLVRAGSYAIPDAPLERRGSNPSVMILMIPWTGQNGNLESFCLPAAMAASPNIAIHVNKFATDAGVGAWPEVTLNCKMKLRSLLAVRHKPDPFIGLGNIWGKDESIIPLRHNTFEQVANVLSQFMA